MAHILKGVAMSIIAKVRDSFLPLLGDVGLGILTLMYVMEQNGRVDASVFWLLPLMFLPDLEALPKLLRRGKAASSLAHPKYNHEEVLPPILWLAPTGLWWHYGGFYGEVACMLLFVHFLHKSVLIGWGVSWFRPFWEDRLKFFADYTNKNSLSISDWIRVFPRFKLRGLIDRYGDEEWVAHNYHRVTVVSVIEYGLFLWSLVVLYKWL